MAEFMFDGSTALSARVLPTLESIEIDPYWYGEDNYDDHMELMAWAEADQEAYWAERELDIEEMSISQGSRGCESIRQDEKPNLVRFTHPSWEEDGKVCFSHYRLKEGEIWSERKVDQTRSYKGPQWAKHQHRLDANVKPIPRAQLAEIAVIIQRRSYWKDDPERKHFMPTLPMPSHLPFYEYELEEDHNPDWDIEAEEELNPSPLWL